MNLKQNVEIDFPKNDVNIIEQTENVQSKDESM